MFDLFGVYKPSIPIDLETSWFSCILVVLGAFAWAYDCPGPPGPSKLAKEKAQDILSKDSKA